MTKLLSATALALIMSASLGQARTYDWQPDRHGIADYSPIGLYRHRAAHRHVKMHRVNHFTFNAILVISRRPARDLAAIPLPRPRPKDEPKPDLTLIQKARVFLGTNPTHWRSLWCARFMAMIAPHAARRLRNPNLAREWANLPHVPPRIGAIVVLSRGNGGHVGVVEAFDRRGNPVVVSGNHNHRVGRGTYDRHRVIAYVEA